MIINDETPLPEPKGSIFDIRDIFLKMSDQGFDPLAKKLVREWSPQPTALEILKTLDACIFSSLCSSLEITAMGFLFDHALKLEGTTKEEVFKLATWRDDPNYGF